MLIFCKAFLWNHSVFIYAASISVPLTDACHFAHCCTRVPPATASSQLTRIVALVFVWRPMPATLRSVLRTCLSGGRCLRRSLTVSAQDVLACGRHLIDGVLHLTIALLPRDKCCFGTAYKLFRPHANARTRLKLLQDTLISLTSPTTRSTCRRGWHHRNHVAWPLRKDDGVSSSRRRARSQICLQLHAV